jgi:vancomycin resistance protein YoaR
MAAATVIDISIETTVEEPKITKETIDKYKIKELVGSAKTNFEGGSLDRQHNIEVGVSKLNGVLLAPGEEFSAVNAIGEVTEEAGFVKEYVISGGKTQKEIGGGLCQLATTLFRLALDSGLPIIERVNHRYVISYYGAGLDATIYGPHPDLRFINDTGNYLLLQGKAQNNEVIFEFYGKKDGRSVKISEPKLSNRIPAPETKNIPTADLPAGKTKCSEIPHSGVTADATYTVTYPNGEISETNFHSVYQPWQKVCLVGIGNE